MKLITRSDFDGLVSAAILEELGIIDDIMYVHPKDLQDNKIEVTQNDVLVNVPLVEGCGLWFDHHSSEQERLQLKEKFKGACEEAPSAAHVINKYYMANEEYANKLKKFEELIRVVDISDSAQYTKEDIVNPQGWMMLAFIADPRTGLGYHHHFRISNFELMKSLPRLFRTKSIEEILAMPDFKERVDIYREESKKFQEVVREHARIEGDAIVLDFRGITDIPSGNRFIEYTLYPDQNISVRLVDGKNREFVMISIGHSIINKTSSVDVGSLSLKYGGGGHKKVGTCQVPYEESGTVLKKILEAINS
jgi:oligoribonuclease NrnB/cAMP/cGMP phosphodiesterase (DHH superfamily)